MFNAFFSLFFIFGAVFIIARTALRLRAALEVQVRFKAIIRARPKQRAQNNFGITAAEERTIMSC